MIAPKREWREFYSEDQKMDKLKEWKIISPKSNEIKKLYYKGIYTNHAVECDVIGYVDDNEIILEINSELHSILPEYFVEMQKRERFIIVDIETPKSFSPVSGIREVAAIFVEDYRVVDEIHLAIINDKELYKLGYGQGLDAIEENEEMKKKFKAFTTKHKCPMVAHNATFDRSFLKYWGWIDETQEFYCSMNNIKRQETLSSYKLEYILNHYKIKNDQTHTAIQDVLDLLEVLKAVKIERWEPLAKSSEPTNPSAKANSVEWFKKKKPQITKDQREENKKKLELAKENVIKNIFEGKKLVFTGDMSKDRNDMMEIAIHYGATTATSISGKTGMVVIGVDAGKSKLAKAESLGIKIITEKEFWDIIETGK